MCGSEDGYIHTWNPKVNSFRLQQNLCFQSQMIYSQRSNLVTPNFIYILLYEEILLKNIILLFLVFLQIKLYKKVEIMFFSIDQSISDYINLRSILSLRQKSYLHLLHWTFGCSSLKLNFQNELKSSKKKFYQLCSDWCRR